MLRFHRLTVERVEPQAEDAVEITFAVPPELAEEYRFAPGQHINVRKAIDGEDVRRSYSICSSPASGRLRIGVRRIPDGAFSSHANEALRPGDELEVMTPGGRFTTPLDPAQHKHYVCFAAGSGITPILSIASAVLETEPESEVTLFYGNRTLATTMFREALMDLKNLHLERLALQFILSREQTELEICNGRIDGERAGELLAAFCAGRPVDEVFICGPDTMIDEVVEAAKAFGIDERSIHFERFATNPKAMPARPRTEHKAEAGAGETHVTVIMDSHHKEFAMARDTDSVLDAGHAAGIDLPFSCKSAVCSTCRAKLVEGEVEMESNYALEPWEAEAGYVLTCQSFPKTDRIVLDYDQ